MECLNPIRIPEDVRCISFVGGGGKTTLMLRLAREQSALGRRVIVTTTTHMFRPDRVGKERQYPEDLIWITEEDPEQVTAGLDRAGYVLVGPPDERNGKKITGVSPAFFREMMALADLVLVEADGSRRRPVKVPKAREPVIPEESELTAAVAGLTALGRPLGECCYNPGDVAALLDRELPLRSAGDALLWEDPGVTGVPVPCSPELLHRGEEHLLTGEELARILISPEGLRKSAGSRYMVLLNQADNEELTRQGQEILEILAEVGIPGQLCTRRDRLDLVLLAAGNSTRFGGNKLLAELADGKPMYMHMVELAESLPADTFHRRILVSQYPEILETVGRRPGWTCIRNEHPELGQSRSVILGTEVSPDTDGWMFCVCDQPELGRESLMRLIRAWRGSTLAMAAMSLGGAPRNPAIFSACCRKQLLGLTGDRGGGRLMAAAPQDVIPVEAGSEEELRDVDTREDLF